MDFRVPKKRTMDKGRLRLRDWAGPPWKRTITNVNVKQNTPITTGPLTTQSPFSLRSFNLPPT